MHPSRNEESEEGRETYLPDADIQKLLREKSKLVSAGHIVASRPASLVIAFFTVTCVASFLLDSPLYSSSLVMGQLLRVCLTEVRFNAFVGIVFWMCFRGGATLGLSRLVPWTCICCTLIWETVLGRSGLVENGVALWLMVYRLALLWLVFEIVRRGFRISLQPAREPNANVPELNLATLLIVMSLFAVLLLADIQIRRSPIGVLTRSMMEFPPILALVSGCTRSLLWVGMVVMLARGERRYALFGLAVLGSWLVSRSAVVLYLDWIHYPNLERQGAFVSPLPVDVLIAMQVIQFVLGFVTSLFFVWTGYRFRIAIAASPTNPESPMSSFDSVA